MKNISLSSIIVSLLNLKMFYSYRHYSEQQRTTRLKARRARLAEGRRREEQARLAEFGIAPTSPHSHSKIFKSKALLHKEVGPFDTDIPWVGN